MQVKNVLSLVNKIHENLLLKQQNIRHYNTSCFRQALQYLGQTSFSQLSQTIKTKQTLKLLSSALKLRLFLNRIKNILIV